MEHFIDREQEMETLQTEYDRNGSSLVILYGRRRVGKTTLISEFIKDKKALYFLASEESESQNRSAFQEKAAEFLDNDLLRNAAVNMERLSIVMSANNIHAKNINILMNMTLLSHIDGERQI